MKSKSKCGCVNSKKPELYNSSSFIKCQEEQIRLWMEVISNVTFHTYCGVEWTEFVWEREQASANIHAFESNWNIDLEEREVEWSWWGWKRVKKECKTESKMKWGQSCAESLTSCLAPCLSVAVASVWWICSHPVRGGYREKCCLSERPASLQRGDVRCEEKLGLYR